MIMKLQKSLETLVKKTVLRCLLNRDVNQVPGPRDPKKQPYPDSSLQSIKFCKKKLCGSSSKPSSGIPRTFLHTGQGTSSPGQLLFQCC